MTRKILIFLLVLLLLLPIWVCVVTLAIQVNDLVQASVGAVVANQVEGGFVTPVRDR